MSSSGLVRPSADSVREAPVGSRLLKAPLVLALTVPEPEARSPSQMTLARRTAGRGYLLRSALQQNPHHNSTRNSHELASISPARCGKNDGTVSADRVTSLPIVVITGTPPHTSALTPLSSYATLSAKIVPSGAA